MNILFLTLGEVETISSPGIYTDLYRKFRDEGHGVYIVSANERRTGKNTEFYTEENANFLRVKIGNITKCGMLEKGISTLLVEYLFTNAIKKYLSNVKFDLVFYTTPPITFANVVKFIKNRDGAKSYLALKDIFPQNALDIGVLKTSGIKGFIYRYFRKKEKALYALSDTIGCMSPANCEYVLENNPEVLNEKVELFPNTIEYRDVSVTAEEKCAIREKYGIPQDKKVFVYGGNLGRPQGIPFIIECLKSQAKNENVFFLIVGNGTEFSKLEEYYSIEKPVNVKIMQRLPREDYDAMISACDVGLIFLDYRFTIPNYPSRLLAYMQAGLPVVAATDVNTDIGEFLTKNGLGWWCESNDVQAFGECVEKAIKTDKEPIAKKTIAYLKENYSVEKSYKIIMGK